MNKDVLIPQPHIKGLIFDLDGTLADTMPMHIEAWIAAGKEYGADITGPMIDERAGTPTIEVVQDLNQTYDWDIDPYQFRDRRNKIYHDLKDKAGPIQPIHNIIEIAKSNLGVRPMGIGTGSIKTNATLALKELGITDWFDIIVTADDVDQPKPHPETFLRSVHHFGLQPHECLVYEDSPVGIKAALDGGMHAIHILTLEYFTPQS